MILAALMFWPVTLPGAGDWFYQGGCVPRYWYADDSLRNLPTGIGHLLEIREMRDFHGVKVVRIKLPDVQGTIWLECDNGKR